MKVLGFTGFFGSGKGTVIKMISDLTGAVTFSTSEEVALECISRGLPTDRPTKRVVANDVREKFGPGEFSRIVEKILRLPKENKIALVDALRTQGEIQVLKEAFGKNFVLVSVEAPENVRYERIKLRARDAGDELSFEEFIASEEKENSPDAKPFEQSLGSVAKLADFRLVNDGSQEELKNKVTDFLKKQKLL